MAFTAGLLSVATAYVAPGRLLWGSFALTFVAVLLLEALTIIVYVSQIWPKLLSPLKSLPSAPNPSFWNGQFRRILAEDTGVPMKGWINNVPNQGLIRYTAVLNSERVLTTSPEALREVLVTKSYDFAKPEIARQTLGRLLGFGVLLAEGDEHKFQRKNLMPAFQYRHVKNLVPAFWSKSAQMVRKVDESDKEGISSLEGTVIKLTTWISRCTLDIIGLTGMGFDFNAIEDPTSELNVTYTKIFSPSKQARNLQLAGLFIPIWLLRLLPVARNNDIAEAAATIRRNSREVIQRKKQAMAKAADDNSARDILSVALESNAFTEENLVDQTMTFLAAGHETTSSATSWALVALAKDQEIQEKLRDEVRQLLPSPLDPNGVVTAEMIDACHYLHAVCNEVLRVYAPVPMTRREAIRDTEILGVPIKKGTDIIICPAAINVSDELWGQNASKFNPDRWLDKNANSGGAVSNFAMLTFLHGPRSCIGQAFSKQEFACLLASIVGHYQFELEPKDCKVQVQSGVTMRPKGGLDLRMKSVAGW